MAAEPRTHNTRYNLRDVTRPNYRELEDDDVIEQEFRPVEKRPRMQSQIVLTSGKTVNASAEVKSEFDQLRAQLDLKNFQLQQLTTELGRMNSERADFSDLFNKRRLVDCESVHLINNRLDDVIRALFSAIADGIDVTKPEDFRQDRITDVTERLVDLDILKMRLSEKFNQGHVCSIFRVLHIPSASDPTQTVTALAVRHDAASTPPFYAPERKAIYTASDIKQMSDELDQMLGELEQM